MGRCAAAVLRDVFWRRFFDPKLPGLRPQEAGGCFDPREWGLRHALQYPGLRLRRRRRKSFLTVGSLFAWWCDIALHLVASCGVLMCDGHRRQLGIISPTPVHIHSWALDRVGMCPDGSSVRERGSHPIERVPQRGFCTLEILSRLMVWPVTVPLFADNAGGTLFFR